jgi:2,3-bisphosphoglycerate-dependent phosphoglycerate mutase
MITVWMVRHGQSQSNAGAPSGDPAAIPLSATGSRQAAEIAQVFDRAPNLVVTSPFLRAQQTAQPTLDRFSLPDPEIWPVQEFTYLGRLHGRPTTGAQRKPRVDAYWNAADPSYVDDAHSESFIDVHARAHQFLAGLPNLSGGLTTVFTHGLFMRVVLWLILTGSQPPTTDSMRRFHRFRTNYLIPNASIITLYVDPKHGVRVLGGSTNHIPPALRTGE